MTEKRFLKPELIPGTALLCLNSRLWAIWATGSEYFAPLRSGSTFPALRFASFGSFCLFLLLLSSCPICFGACPRLKIEFNFRHAQINIFIMRGARVSCNFLIPTAPKKAKKKAKKSQKTNKENTRRKRRHFPLGGGPPLGGRGVSQFFIYR